MTTSHCPSPQPASSAGRKAALLGLATVAGLLLAACGGNSDSPPPPPPPVDTTQVPASAAATDATLEMFAISLAPSDTTEPLGLDLVKTLPTSETEDPIATP